MPHKLAAFAEKWGGRVIHPSTDCVFSGKKGGYSEDDPSDAEDLYGKTKYLGELQLRKRTDPAHFDDRPRARGAQIPARLAALSRGEDRPGIQRVIYSGVTTLELAELVTLIVLRFPALSGLYQVASEPISKYDLLCLLKDAFRVAVEIVPEDTTISDRSMKGDKLRQAMGYQCPSWPELIRALAEDPTPYDRRDDR